MSRAEEIAYAFHATYEHLAPEYGYETREASAVPWKDVPEANKNLMIAVVRSLIADGVIAAPPVTVNVHVTGTTRSEAELVKLVQDAVRNNPLRGR